MASGGAALDEARHDVEILEQAARQYRGARKHELDLNRSATIVNLFEVAHRRAA